MDQKQLDVYPTAHLTFNPMLPYSSFSLAKATNKGELFRVYGVAGDAHLQKIVVDTLMEAALEADARDFNLDTVDGEGATVGEVLSLCGNIPFLAERRVVLVQRAERIENMHRGSGDGDEGKASKGGKVSPAKRLTEGLKNLPPSTMLILQRTPETPEPGSRPGTTRCINANVDKAFDDGKLGLLIDCVIPSKGAAMVSAIIESEAARRGIAIERSGAAYLVERAGQDIAHLLNELEKCALRAGGAPISRAIIDEMVKRAPNDTIFDLMDALGERKGAKAIGMLRELVGGGEAPERVLITFVGHLRKLLQARAFLDAGLSLDGRGVSMMPGAFAAQFPQNGNESIIPLLTNPSQSWRVRKLSTQARQFSTSQIVGALEAACAVDLAIKGIEGDGGADSRTQPSLLLELLIARLC